MDLLFSGHVFTISGLPSAPLIEPSSLFLERFFILYFSALPAAYANSSQLRVVLPLSSFCFL
jgi:hypothetical protein